MLLNKSKVLAGSMVVFVYGFLVILAGASLFFIIATSAHFSGPALFLNMIGIYFSIVLISTGIFLIKLKNWARLLVLVLLTLWLGVVTSFAASFQGDNGFSLKFFISNRVFFLAHFIPLLISYYLLNHPKIKARFK